MAFSNPKGQNNVAVTTYSGKTTTNHQNWPEKNPQADDAHVSLLRTQQIGPGAQTLDQSLLKRSYIIYTQIDKLLQHMDAEITFALTLQLRLHLKP